MNEKTLRSSSKCNRKQFLIHFLLSDFIVGNAPTLFFRIYKRWPLSSVHHIKTPVVISFFSRGSI